MTVEVFVFGNPQGKRIVPLPKLFISTFIGFYARGCIFNRVHQPGAYFFKGKCVYNRRGLVWIFMGNTLGVH